MGNPSRPFLSGFSGFFLSARRFKVAVIMSFRGAPSASFSTRSKRVLASRSLYLVGAGFVIGCTPSSSRLPMLRNSAHFGRKHSGQERPSFSLIQRPLVARDQIARTRFSVTTLRNTRNTPLLIARTTGGIRTLGEFVPDEKFFLASNLAGVKSSAHPPRSSALLKRNKIPVTCLFEK
jgi:hypothetical protein